MDASGNDTFIEGTELEPLYEDTEDPTPLVVFCTILSLSALVFLILCFRRRIMQICTKRKYKDKRKNDDATLHKDDELDDPTECLLSGKLEIGNHYNTYKATNIHGHPTNIV